MSAVPAATLNTRPAGIALIAASIGAVFVMAHHPVADGANFLAFAASADRIGALNQSVHGGAMVLVAVLTWTMVTLALARGVHRVPVLMAMVAWAIGAFGMLIAPVFNGFVVIDIARRALADPVAAESLRTTLQVLGAGVRVVAVVGAIGLSSAIALVSADLTRSGGATRWVGAAGVVIGVVPVVAIAAGVLTLSVAGLTGVTVAWGVWFVAVGVLMVRRQVQAG